MLQTNIYIKDSLLHILVCASLTDESSTMHSRRHVHVFYYTLITGAIVFDNYNAEHLICAHWGVMDSACHLYGDTRWIESRCLVLQPILQGKKLRKRCVDRRRTSHIIMTIIIITIIGSTALYGL